MMYFKDMYVNIVVWMTLVQDRDHCNRFHKHWIEVALCAIHVTTARTGPSINHTGCTVLLLFTFTSQLFQLHHLFAGIQIFILRFYKGWTKSLFTLESVAASSSSVEVGRRGGVMKCKIGQWECNAMASFSRRQLTFCVCEYYLNNGNFALITT